MAVSKDLCGNDCRTTIWITSRLCLAQTPEVVSFMHKRISGFAKSSEDILYI